MRLGAGSPGRSAGATGAGRGRRAARGDGAISRSSVATCTGAGISVERTRTGAGTYSREAWRAAVGTMEQTHLRLPTGTSCIGVWSVDSFNRPSDRPAVLSVRVLPPVGH